MPHPQEIVILGCGGNSVDVLEAVEAAHAASGGPRCRYVAFLDDDSSRWGERLHGVEVSGPLARASEFPEARFVFTIGSPKSFWRRGEILERLGLPDERFETVVHPTASVSPTAELGPGTVVLQNVTIASNVRIGRHVMILPNTVVSHDGTVGDYTCLAGGVCVSGNVTVGRSCYLGTNCSIIGHATIHDGALVGMGAAIVEDVPAGTVYAGVPGRFLRRVEEAESP